MDRPDTRQILLSGRFKVEAYLCARCPGSAALWPLSEYLAHQAKHEEMDARWDRSGLFFSVECPCCKLMRPRGFFMVGKKRLPTCRICRGRHSGGQARGRRVVKAESIQNRIGGRLH